jgi:hypothetical protein
VHTAPTEPAIPESAAEPALPGPDALVPAIVVPRAAVANLRRSILMAAALGTVSLLLLGLLGHLVMGLFVGFGLALGAVNSHQVQRAVVAYAASGQPNKKARFTRSILGRLGIVTVLALASALLVRPDGLGVFAGLAFFQMIMLGGAAVPVFKQLRQS